MKPDYGSIGGPLRPAPEPQRSSYAKAPPGAYVAGEYAGTDRPPEADSLGDPLISVWNARYRNWHNGFEQEIGPKYRRFWAYYRNHDTQPLAGPNSEWRDRTILPEAFKHIENDVARTVLGQFSGHEWFAVKGRESSDEEHEDKIRELLRHQFDSMGRGWNKEAFLKRMTDALRYRAITGHVWLEATWNRETRMVKQRVPLPEGGTETQEVLEVMREGVDIDWLPLDSVACDLSNANKWKIKMVKTSLEALRAEERNYRAEFPDGPPLFEEGALENLEFMSIAAVSQEMPQEPRDTEHWPLNQDQIVGDPAETPVELWICYDNVERTITKIANRQVVLAHGYSDTPDGFDPIISVPYIPVPNRVYGESLLHYVGPLIQMQTRIARARMDEILLNIWQQMIIRQGAVRSTKFFFTPGGALQVEGADPNRPVSDAVTVLPRRPVFTEAWTEEGHRQRQAELAAGNDAMMQGGEATTKSRDVSATEAQQRVLQGNARKQLEAFYLEYVLKRPLLQKSYDLIRMHMTQPMRVRVLGNEVAEVNLEDLQRPVDIMVGGGLREYVTTERRQQLQMLIQLTGSPAFAPYIKAPAVLEKIMETMDWENPKKFIKTPEEVQSEQQQQAIAQMAGQNPGSPESPTGIPQLPTPPVPRPEAGQAGAAGEEPPPPPEAMDELL